MDLASHLAAHAPLQVRLIIQTIANHAPRVQLAIREQAGRQAGKNAYGEQQTSADVVADRIIVDALAAVPAVASICTEERGEVLRTGRPGLGVAVDPLDGSKNAEKNLPCGIIAGIYENAHFLGVPRIAGVCYVLFGPASTLAYSAGTGVHEFVFDGSAFQYRRELRMPLSGDVFIPSGKHADWLPAYERLFNRAVANGSVLRNVGSLVADVTNLFHAGGLFTYPATRARPNGKLRLLFESIPFAYLVEQAGGGATDGKRRILELELKQLTDVSPAYIGSKDSVAAVEV